MLDFKTFFESKESIMNVSLTKPWRHDQRNKERGINRKHQNIIPNKYKLQPGEIPAIKYLQQGTHKRVPVNRGEARIIAAKYKLNLVPGQEKCINSNSRIFIKIRENGSGEVYIR